MKILDFPNIRQTFDYDCGAKALQAVLAYYGIEIKEELLIKYAKTDPKKGTYIHEIVSTLDKFNLEHESKSMTIKDVKKYIDKNIPVLVLLQAWNGDKIDYKTDYKDGHWVIAIGYDDDKIYFEDPYSFERTFLENKEFETRWHGKEDNKKIVNHGIAVYGKTKSYSSEKIIHMD